jgi:hypothetical protein
MITLQTASPASPQYVTSTSTLSDRPEAAHRFYGLAMARRVGQEFLRRHPEVEALEVISHLAWEATPRRIAILTQGVDCTHDNL